MAKRQKKGGIVIDATAFNQNYIAREAMRTLTNPLPDSKIEELGKLITHLVDGKKISLRPVKRTAESGEYEYNHVDFVGRNGTMSFFPPYHPDLERFLMDYLTGSIIVAFKLEEVCDAEKG